MSGRSLWCVDPPGKKFHGTIEIERRDGCMYYVWRLQDDQGEFLAQVGQSVSFCVIPDGQDPFEYTLSHAIEGLRRYRIGRKRSFDVVHTEWKKDHRTSRLR